MPDEDETPRSLKVRLRSRDQTYFEGMAYSFSSTNEVGDFDILPEHANFITLVLNKITIDKGLKTELVIPLEKGIVSAQSDIIDGYIGF